MFLDLSERLQNGILKYVASSQAEAFGIIRGIPGL